MQIERLTELLQAVQAGQTSVDAALDVLRDLPYEVVADYGRLDHHRALRTGLPEVIYGAGKTPEQIARLMERLAAANGLAVATRVSVEQAQAVQALLPAAVYHSTPRILTQGAAPRELLTQAALVIVVAGMEGALASVVGGLVAAPVIAVPTSIGYGASFGGLAALLAMLNSCAPGVAVVNIDNGFGAAALAMRILSAK
jgi:NCAIR mutase (PurE)-related protein